MRHATIADAEARAIEAQLRCPSTHVDASPRCASCEDAGEVSCPHVVVLDETLVLAFMADLRNGVDGPHLRETLTRSSTIAAFDEAVLRLLGERERSKNEKQILREQSRAEARVLAEHDRHPLDADESPAEDIRNALQIMQLYAGSAFDPEVREDVEARLQTAISKLERLDELNQNPIRFVLRIAQMERRLATIEARR